MTGGLIQENALMRGHPTTSAPAGERRRRESLSERFRAWRLQPRKHAPRLSGILFALGALLDTFTAGSFVCLLSLPPLASALASAAGSPWTPLRQAMACAGVSAALLAAGAVGRQRLSRIVYAFGLAFGVAAAAWTAAGLWEAPGAGLGWVACLALACGLVLEGVYRHGICAFAGSAVAGLLLLLVDRVPGASVLVLSPARDLFNSSGWQTARGVGLVAASGALMLAWGLGILTLGLILVAPQRRSSARTFSGAAYRALGLAVFLLAAGSLMGGLPRGRPVEVVALLALVGNGFLLHARFAGWVQDLGLALGCAGGGIALVVAACAAPLVHARADGQALRVLAWVCCFAAANASLAVHAIRRYWFTSESSQ
jgi:hypothetical protein